MKKIVTCFIMTLFLFSAVGCSANAENNTTTEKNDPEEISQSQQRDENAELLQSQMPKEGDEIAVIQTNKGEIRMQIGRAHV